MAWTYRIARIAGTDVKLHVTFVGFLALVAWQAWEVGGAPLALARVGLFLAVFLCVLLHEYGHILMARRFGVRTPDVILLPIGGVARLERIPSEPRQELLVALAGPAVTLAIVVLLYGGLLAAGERPTLIEWGVEDSAPQAVMQLNLWLLLFNLLPAFPMDGGRVLRALLAMRIGLERATRTAAALGQVLAFGMAFYGLTRGPAMLVLIAFFVFLGAGAEASAVRSRAAGEGIDVSRMMVTEFRTLPVHASLGDAVDLLLAGVQREFPVVDNLGRVEGLLTRDDLIRGLSRDGPRGTVSSAMTAGPPMVPPGTGFEDALDRLRASGLPALPVVDEGGRLVGMLTMDNVSDLLLVRRAVQHA